MDLSWVDWSLVLSIAVAIGAFIGWLDSRRRTSALERRTAVTFRIEEDGRFEHWYRLRNVGDKAAGMVQIDGNSVTSWELGGSTMALRLDPNESTSFTLKTRPNSRPDTIRVTWISPFEGEEQVVFPTEAAVPPVDS